MTYCLALMLDAGFVCVSDSRTNAGVDNVAIYSKLHRFEVGDRMFVLMSSGNLATTQAVVTRLRRDLEEQKAPNFSTIEHPSDAAAYVGDVSVAVQRASEDEQAELRDEFRATFILAVHVPGDPHMAYLVYPEGNYIAATDETPYLQIGELKTGKAILDRLARRVVPLGTAARIALVSMEAAMRSNVSVGPPVEMVVYEAGADDHGRYVKFEHDNPYWRKLSRAWNEQLRLALDRLPRFDWE